jgi:hypothetical protein
MASPSRESDESFLKLYRSSQQFLKEYNPCTDLQAARIDGWAFMRPSTFIATTLPLNADLFPLERKPEHDRFIRVAR